MSVFWPQNRRANLTSRGSFETTASRTSRNDKNEGARQRIVYWTNINRDIEEAVRHCRNCQEAAKMPKKTAVISWTTEKKPWDRIHIDYDH
ncbi:hypothetical protein RB195_022515 [Necator americanus]|uniref:RNA-directed DNA polymerase n=1 Tax=Necator americanus TaxID=51031 RepID=A0ABR1EI54_NECAM